MQARALAPKISPATLSTIERDPSALRMLIVRHPFNRLGLGRRSVGVTLSMQVGFGLQGQTGEVHRGF